MDERERVEWRVWNIECTVFACVFHSGCLCLRSIFHFNYLFVFWFIYPAAYRPHRIQPVLFLILSCFKLLWPFPANAHSVCRICLSLNNNMCGVHWAWIHIAHCRLTIGGVDVHNCGQPMVTDFVHYSAATGSPSLFVGG